MNMFNLDDVIIIFLQNNLSPIFIEVLKYLTNLADEAGMIAVVGLFYWCLDREFGLKLYLNLSAANIFYPMLKNVVRRTRPYIVNKEIKCLKPVVDGDIYDTNLQGYSFPSGHMINTTVVYEPIFKKYKNNILRVILVILSILIGSSRFILGVHYPSDVLVGLIFGLLIVFILNILNKKIGDKKTYILIAIIGLSGFLYCESNDYYTGYGLYLAALPLVLFKEKFVFKETKNIKEIIIRMIGGIVVFLGISYLLKLPFSKEILNSKTMTQYIIRVFRYSISSFITLGLYPKLFKYIRFK